MTEGPIRAALAASLGGLGNCLPRRLRALTLSGRASGPRPSAAAVLGRLRQLAPDEFVDAANAEGAGLILGESLTAWTGGVRRLVRGGGQRARGGRAQRARLVAAH